MCLPDNTSFLRRGQFAVANAITDKDEMSVNL